MTPRAPEHRWPLVGLEAPTAELLEAVEASVVGGIVLSGPPGVGKTALASRTVEQAAARELPVARIVATRAGRDLAHAALATLLDLDGDLAEPIAERLRRSLGRGAGGSPDRILLFVDDAPLLDASSAAAIAELVRDDRAFLLATRRSRTPLPASFDALVVEGRLQERTLEPLTEDDLREACERALGGSLHRDAHAVLWRASAGVPLHARELVHVNVARGLLLDKPEGWTFVDRPVAPPSLLELIASRFASLTDDEQRAFEALAVAQPIDLAAATDLLGVELLAELERADLVEVSGDAASSTVRLGHPLFEEVVNEAIGPLQRRRAAQRAVEVLEDPDRDDPDLLLRAAVLRVDHGLELDPATMVAAARRALSRVDPQLAERLLRVTDHDGFDAHFTLGTALVAQGRVDEADRVLGMAALRARTDEERARVISRRGNNLGTGAGRFTDAVAVLEEGLATIEDPHWRSFIAADLTYVGSWTGDGPASAPAGAADRPAAVRANECLVGAVVAVMGGELAAAEDLVVEGLPLTPAIAGDVPTARELLTLSHFLALAFRGDRSGAEAVVEAEMERARDRSDAAPGTWLAVRAIQRAIDGDLTKGLTDAEDAIARLDLADVSGLRPLAMALRSTILAQLGDVTASEVAATEIDEAWRTETKVRAQLAQAAAWRRALAGDVRGAAKVAAEAGRAAVDANHLPLGALAAHQAVRLGHPAPAIPVLRDAARRWEGPLSRAIVGHAEALAGERPDDLIELARRFPRLGFTIVGAEAAAQAARLHDQHGRTGDARRAEFLAAQLAAGVGARPTPSLGTPRGLTDREHEVAARAAVGTSARDIGAELEISRRTVENHLASVYRKLGIGARGQLAEALSQIDGPSRSDAPSS